MYTHICIRIRERVRERERGINIDKYIDIDIDIMAAAEKCVTIREGSHICIRLPILTSHQAE